MFLTGSKNDTILLFPAFRVQQLNFLALGARGRPAGLEPVRSVCQSARVSSRHINSLLKNVLIQSSLYFMLPRAIRKELLPVCSQ